MSFVTDLVGALVITYGVSRLLLLFLRRMAGGQWQLAATHVLSWVLINGFLSVFRWSPYSGYASDAGLIYAFPQLLWFALDRYREVWVRT